jgi:membrane-bound lytic murein transglycosylase B
MQNAPERPPFGEWLDGVRRDALARGIRAETLEQALSGLEPIAIVVERDRKQAEFTLSLDRYMTRRLTKQLVRDTTARFRHHKALLQKVSRAYGVPSQVLVAVWALESNLGRFSGVRPTVATLATLAWDGRRPFFRSELLDALAIVDHGDVELNRMKGSWAGAMGQVQFMPSSYLKYAKDFDGDGRKDIWSSSADVFASIANYLKENGWTASMTWGREVRVPTGARDAVMLAAPLRTEGCRAEREMTTSLPLDKWRALGLTTASGARLPRAEGRASLLDTGTRTFLLYPNYESLLEYNCAHAYALSVGVLSDRIAGERQYRPPLKRARP